MTIQAYYSASDKRIHIEDADGNTAVSAPIVAAAGAELDVVFKWDPVADAMGIWVNGALAATGAACDLGANVETVKLMDVTGGVAQGVYSVQVWPQPLTAGACAGLAAWGRPEPELAFVVPPADTKNTNCAYRLFNMPGDAPGGLRVLATAGANQDQLRLALRPLRAPSTLKFECEGGTLGADTAGAADADASGGNVARFTPTASTWATRATVTIVANPSGLASYLGDYVLFLACKDAAANVGDNLVRFRVNVGGVNGDWSAEVGVAGINTRSLLRLGTFSLPPGGWPEESAGAATTGYGSAYVTVELQVKNGLGTGGGAFDLDALYLAPKEADGVASCAAWVYSTQTLALDWTGETPSGILAFDSRSLEFGGWADWEGADLTLTPTTGEAGVLWGYAYRDAAQQAWPNDTVDLTVYYEPRWRR